MCSLISLQLVGAGQSGQIGVNLIAGKEGDYSSAGVRNAFFAIQTAYGDNLYERLRITSCGKIGIGATDPKWLLEICCNTSTGGGGGYPAISINNPNDAGYSAYYFFKGATNFGGMELSNATCHIFINSLNTFGIQINGTERLRITSSGNVIVCGDIQTPGLYGKSYAVTCTIGGSISVIDTGIPIPNNSTYLVSFTANPATAGGVYSWNEVGYLIINSQWNGSTNTNLIKYTALAGGSLSAYPGSISLHPSFLVSGTEYTQTTSYAPSGQIRLKFCGFSNSAGASQAVYLTRIM
jgi:hypothetical protein